MSEICAANSGMVVRRIVLLSLLIFSVLLSHIALADEKSHYAVARQLVELTYNEQAMYEAAHNNALLAVKGTFENNPKTKDYSAVLTSAVMEIMDAYFREVETQSKIKTAFANIYTEEFTEYELGDFIKFYKTPIGQKALQKLPIVMQKGSERASEIGRQISSSPKYEQMLLEKVKALQDEGVLPRDSDK